MTSDQIRKDAAQGGWNLDEDPRFNPNMSTEVAQLRMTTEVAYQLAMLNEQIGNVLNSREAQIRVLVEPGDWPIQTQQKNR